VERPPQSIEWLHGTRIVPGSFVVRAHTAGRTGWSAGTTGADRWYH